MDQMIIRVTDDSEDVEVLQFDSVHQREYFKRVGVKELLEKLIPLTESAVRKIKEPLHFLNPEVLAINKNRVLIRQEGRKRIVTYESRAFNINFPNALYVMTFNNKKVDEIEAYTYKEWNGAETKLYSYPMPNQLHGNRICIGSAPREIKDDDYVKALENIIFTRYSHSWVDGIKSFKNTIPYFEYLEKNDFPYNLLFDLKKVLKEIMKNG